MKREEEGEREERKIKKNNGFWKKIPLYWEFDNWDLQNETATKKMVDYCVFWVSILLQFRAHDSERGKKKKKIVFSFFYYIHLLIRINWA